MFILFVRQTQQHHRKCVNVLGNLSTTEEKKNSAKKRSSFQLSVAFTLELVSKLSGASGPIHNSLLL